MLKLNAVAEGLVLSDSPVQIPNIQPGDVVEYLGHVPGGNVQIRTAGGLEGIASPGCFKELRDDD
jgi:hypothetical protein